MESRASLGVPKGHPPNTSLQVRTEAIDSGWKQSYPCLTRRPASAAFLKGMQPQVNLSEAAATAEPFKGASLPDNRPAARDPTGFGALPSLREADPAQLEGGRGRKGSRWLSLKSSPEGRPSTHQASESGRSSAAHSCRGSC